MFDFVYKHKRMLQLMLALVIIPPFAFFGVDSYLRGGEASTIVATVDDIKVSQQEFNVVLRERQDMMQQMSGGKLPPQMLDNPEMRMAVAEHVVQQKLLMRQAGKMRLTTVDAQLQSLLSQVPAFQENGKFSMDAYEQYLKTRRRSAEDFESELRRDFVLRQITDPYAESVFLPRGVVNGLARMMETERQASTFVLSPAAFESKVTLEADAVQKHYEANKTQFRTNEQVRVEYVVLSIDGLLASTPVDPEDVKRAFDDQAKRTVAQETRQASHILIAVDAKAPQAEKDKAKAKAQDILKQVKAKPAAFAELAKANSQDPGSAANGGDLGVFKRGDMVKPFSDAAFNMKIGEISDVVESTFGYHIIKLTAVTETKPPSFDAEKSKIETELKRQAASKKFAEMSEQFNTMVFEQSDSLKAAAEFTKTQVLQSNFFGRNGVASDSRLNNPKLLQAVFTDDVLKNKRNSEAIEIAPGTVVAARLLEHRPAITLRFDEVQEQIIRSLTRQRAVQLASQEGRALLDKLKKGQEEGVKWGEVMNVAFSNQVKGLDEDTRKQILRADVSKLPAFAGVETPGGYTLIRVTKVTEPEKLDAEKEKSLAQSLQQSYAQEVSNAFLASLKQKAKINIRKENLDEKKEKQ